MHDLKINTTIGTTSYTQGSAKNMAPRGRQSNNKGIGALKKNKSIQKQSQIRRNNSPKNKVSGNQEQPKRRNSENQGKAVEKKTIHGQTTKTKRHPPYKTNQIGDRTIQLTRKKHNRVSQEKLRLQFGFVANPSHSSHHNASNAVADTPTWYYFSRPCHLALHDVTKTQTTKKPTLTAGSGT